MTNKSKIAAFTLMCLLCLLVINPSSGGETHLNLGIEISGHLVPYVGLSTRRGIQEVGINLGFVLPHNLLGSDLTDLAYQGTLYYRYDFINTDFYPRLQLKVLSSPPSAEKDEFLLLLGGGLQYLYSPTKTRFGGGVEINVGLPVSALDKFTWPIPYLSLESSYEFG